MDDFLFVWREPSPWPMIHFFMPALVTIYLNYNFWQLVSIIYFFESAEYLVSTIPGLDYFAETSPMDNLVSDILFGLLGYAAATILRREDVNIPLSIKLTHIVAASGIHTAISAFLALDDRLEAFAPFWAVFVLSALLVGLNELAAYSFVSIGITFLFRAILGGYIPIITIIVNTVMVTAIWLYESRYVARTPRRPLNSA